LAFKARVRRGARKRTVAGFATIGVFGIAALVYGWGVTPSETSEISPSEIVALRFPVDWADGDVTTSAPPATFALASAGPSRQFDASLFSPVQSFPAQPLQATGLAPTLTPAPAATLEKAAEPQAVQPAEAKPTTARTVAVAPERRPAPAPRPRKDTLFNDAQLASIKSRLKLTAYQEQYWPPVESALRDIGLKLSHAAAHRNDPRTAQTRAAEIDPESSEVQRLKSAAFPLIMSMSDEQKREVRTLAQVMGLQQVAASF